MLREEGPARRINESLRPRFPSRGKKRLSMLFGAREWGRVGGCWRQKKKYRPANIGEICEKNEGR